MRMYVCGVPGHLCGGKNVQVPNSVGNIMKGAKAHMTQPEAQKCFGSYLVKEGYQRVGAREYTKGEGHPIVVLDKPSKFGGVLMSGKKGDKGGGGAGGSKKRFNCRGQHGFFVTKI